MQKSKTTFLATVASVGLIASVANAAETIKVGLAVPLTGDFAAYNEVAGAQCMAKMINAEGGINGQEIELLIQDTGSDTQAAISLTERFVSEGVVAMATIPFSDTMIPVAQIAATNGVTLIQSQSTQVEMHTGVVDNFLTNVAPDPYTAAAAANYALSQGVKNVAIFTSDEGGSWSARTPEWFAEVIEANGGTLQAKLNYSSGTTDWSPQIAELKALDPAPDAVYISWAMPDIGILVRQMRSAGLDAWVVGSDGFDDPSLDALANDDPGVLDKVFFGTLAPAVPGSRIEAFQTACAEMGVEVNGLFPALGGDMIKIIEHGIIAAGSTDPSAIRDAIRAADSIPVMSVEAISFKDTNSYALREIPVIGFKDGKRVVLAHDTPANVPAWP
ncbi:MAG: ABC transporter substrate-binding protein [Proteobacteria bacterium]|nr:ABC transporter substrate-binding protein [Pseudomonadota bacterium]